MKKRLLSFTLLPLLVASPISFSSCSKKEEIPESYKEFLNYLTDLSKFPCSFKYDEQNYNGLNQLNLIVKETKTEGAKEEHTLIFSLDVLEIKIQANYYHGYDAFDWTIYITNNSNENSKLISNFNGLDYNLKGENAHIKGIYGDHEKQYDPYDYDLSKRSISWRNDLGRASHRYFPYFNIENDDGGAIFALGWAGTWEADINYDSINKNTNLKFNAVLDLSTILQPHETIRSSLNAVVRYYDRDEDAAMNKWRRWYIDCNMPFQDKTHTKKAQPLQAFCLAADNNNPFSDGSISETYLTYKRSLDFLYEKGVRVDVRWFDAGWYLRPDKVPTPIDNPEEWRAHFLDWWGTVGTWEMDPGKWPLNSQGGSTFKESVDYAAAHNTMTMVWYEPERVAANDGEIKYLDYLVENYGFNKEWVLQNGEDTHTNILNLGNADAYDWLKSRIIQSLTDYGIKIYREDFNCDPGSAFHSTDLSLGDNRMGITENLYYQNHYKLWDEIIKTTSEHNNGCAFLDSCSSGGGRNDLESMRRGVPMLRSDADRTTIPLRLAYSYSLNPWLPYTGCSAKESAEQLEGGDWDQYVLRASYMSVMTYGSKFSYDTDLDYDILIKAQNEWDSLKHFFYKDYYNLTPYTAPTDDTQWNAYMYFDNTNDNGVIQVFRQEHSDNDTYVLKIKGVNDKHIYKIVDADNINGIDRITGAELKAGITIHLNEARGSSVLFIQPI